MCFIHIYEYGFINLSKLFKICSVIPPQNMPDYTLFKRVGNPVQEACPVLH